MKMRAPSIPLITVDPFFSVWSPDETINVTNTVHWTGKHNSIIGTVNIDGQVYSFLGYERNLHKMLQVSLDIDALSTTAVFEKAGIRLTVKFTTPVILGDYRLLTRPVSYMAVSYEATDGKEHTVSATVKASEELCLDRVGQSPIEFCEVSPCECIKGLKMGNTVQKPLNRSGDDHRIDWGYFYLCAKGDGVTVGNEKYRNQTLISVSAPLSEKSERLFLFAYDDIESIEYFGTHLKSYWNKDGQSIEQAICEAGKEYTALMTRCKEFSDKLYADALEAGGEKYAEILSLAYRQVIAAHKLVLDENGEILYISKECFSNGCAATVDVSYPSIPLFLLYDPELVKGMMRPVYRYAETDEWKKKLKYDFAPHDVGQYPLLNGQVYGKRKVAENEYSLLHEFQMPVEECGNMLVMEAAVALATKSTAFANEHFDILEDWVKYLIENGRDPENQLCTDDFAGHLAHNCNLSLKAIMGIAGLAILYGMDGKKALERKYMKLAREMALDWSKRASNGDGSYRLAFDKPGTFSMKYNIVWDKLFGTALMPREVIESEFASYAKHVNAFGMPLDNRQPYTKSDWLVWTATLTNDRDAFESYIAPMWKFFNESPSRVPMTDWYDTVSGRIVGFQNRTVQGGLYMKLLINKWLTVAKEFNV